MKLCFQQLTVSYTMALMLYSKKDLTIMKTAMWTKMKII